MIRSVSFIDRSAARALPARIARTDQNNRNAAAPRFVRNERPQLRKAPRMQARSLPAAGRNPSADMREFFHCDSASGAFSRRNERLRDHVICVFAKSGFLTREFLEPALCAFGIKSLQFALAPCEIRADTLNVSSTMRIAVAIGGNVDDAEIDTEPVRRTELIGFRDVAADSKKPFSPIETQIAFAPPKGEQSSLMRSRNERNLNAPLERPDRDKAITKPEDAIVIWLCTKLAKDRSNFSVYLECIRHFGNRTNCGLGGQPKSRSKLFIREFVQIKLAECASFKALGRKPSACCVAPLKRVSERLMLFLGRLELDRRNELHSFIYRKLLAPSQEGCVYMTLAPNMLLALRAVRDKVKRFLNLQIIIIICDPSP